jgi:hypothetical protein
LVGGEIVVVVPRLVLRVGDEVGVGGVVGGDALVVRVVVVIAPAATTAAFTCDGRRGVRVLSCRRVRCKETATYRMHSRFGEASRGGGGGGGGGGAGRRGGVGRVGRGWSGEFYKAKVEGIGGV